VKAQALLLQATTDRQPFERSQPLSRVAIELDPPGYGEILIRILATGLCHSDLSLITGVIPRPVPAVVGHEAVGLVAELGPGVSDLEVGQRVVTVFVPSCGNCAPCAEGRQALCEPGAAANAKGTLLSGGNRIRLDGDVIHHHLGVSSFAEFAVVSRRSVVPIDAYDVPDEVAALFGCAVLTGVGAVINTAKVRPGETALVVGLGGVGMSALLGAMASGAVTYGADLSDAKLAAARSLGAEATFNAGDPDVVGDVLEATGGGADHVFEMAGSIKALDFAMQVTRRGGTTTVAGLAGPRASYDLAISALVSQERRLQGSYLGSCVPSRDVPRFLGLHKRGLLAVDRLLASTGSLDTANRALDAMVKGDSGRHVMVPDPTH
jgi:alcohol dehydrogenase